MSRLQLLDVTLCWQTSPFSIALIHIYHSFVGSTQQVEIREKGERGFSTLQLAAQGTRNNKISQVKKHCNIGTSYCRAPTASPTWAYEKTGLAVVKSKKEMAQGSKTAIASF